MKWIAGKPVKMVILLPVVNDAVNIKIMGHGQPEPLLIREGVNLYDLRDYLRGNHPLAKVQIGEDPQNPDEAADGQQRGQYEQFLLDMEELSASGFASTGGKGSTLILDPVCDKDVRQLGEAIMEVYVNFEPPAA